MSLKTPIPLEESSTKFTDIGWWTDNRGRKHHGVIPKTLEEQEFRQLNVNKNLLKALQ